MVTQAEATLALTEALVDHDPVDDREAASLRELRDGLRRLPRPFDVDADPTHVTGSALIISERGIVLLKHKRLGLWLQPGGHVDPGETAAEGAAREAWEETGLRVTHPANGPRLVHVDAHDGGRGHRHLDVRYLFFADPVDPTPPADESQECRWFSWTDALDTADLGLQAAIPRLRNVEIR